MARLLRRWSRRCALAVANSKALRLMSKLFAAVACRFRPSITGLTWNVSPRSDRNWIRCPGRTAARDTRDRASRHVSHAGALEGHHIFSRRLSLLPPGLRVRAYVVGSALYRTRGSQHSLEELKRLAGRLGLSERVGFTGFLDEAPEAVRALDILVHASTEPEPFGLVIAEGMACGRAVIASEGGGAAELFEADINALSHPPGDAARLANRIALLATDRSLRARLGAAGRATAERRFNRARLASELIPLYRRVVSSTN